MIVFVVDGLCVGSHKFGSDPPVTANPDGPSSLSVTFEWMKAKAWKSHVFRCRRGIESAQYQSQSLSMLSLNPRFGSSLKEASQTLGLKASDHGLRW